MTDDYKQQITQYVREVVQRRIAQLKEEHPNQLYTHQWQLEWPSGFTEGNNVIPITTQTKDGLYCIGELHLVVPSSYELDLEAMEFVPVNEPYDPPKTTTQPPPLNTSLEMLNAMVTGLNEFLGSVTGEQSAQSLTQPLSPFHPSESQQTGETTHSPLQFQTTSSRDLESIKQSILDHEDLPDWYTMINDREARDTLLTKMAETYVQYRTQSGNQSLSTFFKDYTDFLQDRGKLQNWCTYKSKSVELNEQGWCTETYCSKKPYRKKCPRSTLKFAPAPNND